VRNNSAEDAGPIPRQESDHQLGGLRVRTLFTSEDVLVERFHSVLKGSELYHGVGDLSKPEGRQTLIEPIHTFISHNCVETFSEFSGEFSSVSSLHSDFKRFHRTEENISNNLGTSRREKESQSLVLSCLSSKQSFVNILEDFIEPELSKSLH